MSDVHIYTCQDRLGQAASAKVYLYYVAMSDVKAYYAMPRLQMVYL